MEWGLSSDVDSAVLSVSHVGHFKIPRPAVTFKQLLNFIILFTIYAPQSPAPLPKLRLTGMCMRKFSQPEGIYISSVTEKVDRMLRSDN